MKIIGLMGAQRAGKDTVANLLQSIPGVKIFAFANALKEECAEKYVNCQIVNSTKTPIETVKKADFGWTGHGWGGPKTEYARGLLQEHGESRRSERKSYWLDKTIAAIASASYNQAEDRCDFAVVTDVRHINEIEALKECSDGELACSEQTAIWYINRAAAEQAYIEQLVRGDAGALHRSEIEWRVWMLQNHYTTIDNRFSLLDLADSVRSELNRLGRDGR